jgi:DNA-binding MarR family transcriptional regulator
MGAQTSLQPDRKDVISALDAIRRMVRTLRTSATDIERSTGLSAAQMFVLQLLADAPAESMNDLAARTLTDQSSVSVVVSRLEAKGLVARGQSAADARRTRVTITDAGRAHLAGRPVTVQARLIRALDKLPPDALTALGEHLTQLTALMGAAHEPPSLLFEEDDPSSST